MYLPTAIKLIGHHHIFVPGVRSTGWRLSGLVSTDTEAKCCVCLCCCLLLCAVSEPCSISPRSQRQSGVLHAIKSLPKLSRSRHRRNAALQRLSGIPVYQKWNDPPLDGCTRLASAASLRRGEAGRLRPVSAAQWLAEDVRTPRGSGAGWRSAAAPSAATLTPDSVLSGLSAASCWLGRRYCRRRTQRVTGRRLVPV